MATLTMPQIQWGAGFTGSLIIGVPLDNATSFSRPRDGSQFVQYTSGVEEAWTYGPDYVLTGDLRWIPGSTTVAPLSASGWDGAGGVREFIEWARDRNQFRWIPNRAAPGFFYVCYLMDDGSIDPTPEADGSRALHLSMRNTSMSFVGY